ncbi:flagellar hook-length control protein FliK [Uliginosibacterium gangwonense]|uniref:flagellar hook-length control protein FliK n=1 Tax=Uliginosibacterium gangwonense TaxID=392736 RepID=UPI00039CF0BC|nr:flagellar hook-length control protein FliK [Uliginosibacterium gangwonense]
MIPGDLASRLRQLNETTVQPLSVIHKLPANLPELMTGQQFSAQIQNPLPDGSYQALVAGKTITLALPHSVKSGDVLELIVTGQQEETLTAKLANGLSTAEETAQSTLSQTGRLISQLLTGRFGEQRAVTLAQGQALMPASSSDPQQLSGKLQQALTSSGVFYESHLKDWAEGRTSLATLLREPQAQFMPGKLPLMQMLAAETAPATMGQANLPSAAEQASIASIIPAAIQTEDGRLMQALFAGTPETTTLAETEQTPEAIAEDPTHNLRPGTTEIGKTESHDAANPGTSQTGTLHQAGPQVNAHNQPISQGQQANIYAQSSLSATHQQRIPEPLMPLLYQQLETMATHQMQWQFQPWPGMNVEWDLVDPDQNGTASTTEDEYGWRSNLRMHLPNLGDVDAQLVLSPLGLSIRLDTSSEESAQRMRLAAQNLLDAMKTAGLNINTLSVSAHGSA